MKNFKQTLIKTILPVASAIVLAGLVYAAWTEPGTNPPTPNVPAPVNVGPGIQTKVGTATEKADICVDPFGNGDIKCLGDLVSWPKCTLAGGVPTTVENNIVLCKFPGASCPSGWSSYLNYTETSATFCRGGGSCGTTVTSGSHTFDNIDPATEARTYYDGAGTTTYCPDGCINNCNCWCNGYPGDCRCCCGWAYYPCGSSCSSAAKSCTSTVTSIGCITS